MTTGEFNNICAFFDIINAPANLSYEKSLSDITQTTLEIEGDDNIFYGLNPLGESSAQTLLIPVVFDNTTTFEYPSFPTALRNSRNTSCLQKTSVKGTSFFIGNGIIADCDKDILCFMLYKHKKGSNAVAAKTLFVNKVAFSLAPDKLKAPVYRFIVSRVIPVILQDTRRGRIAKTVQICDSINFVKPQKPIFNIKNGNPEIVAKKTILDNIAMVYDGITE